MKALFYFKAMIYIRLPLMIWINCKKWIIILKAFRAAICITKIFIFSFNTILAKFFLLIDSNFLMVNRASTAT